MRCNCATGLLKNDGDDKKKDDVGAYDDTGTGSEED